MRCISYKTAPEFLHSAEHSLLKSESEHNVILGLANNLALGLLPSDDALYFSVLRDSTPVGHAIRSDHRKPFAVSRMDSEAVSSLVEYLVGRNISIHEVSGPAESSQDFASAWEARSRISPRLIMHLGVYELDRVIFPEPDGRSLIAAAAADREIVIEYLLGFFADCFPEEKDPHGRAAEIADRQIQNSTLFLWKGRGDPQPVSMAAKSRESRNGATISFVYTPEHLRGFGFASRIVAALSDRCLKSGKKFCNLFTDLMNPTSNSIYRKIGYRKLGEAKHFSLPES